MSSVELSTYQMNNPYREENKSLYLAYLSNMNYPLREVISVSLQKPLYLI